ncbi:MAG: YqaJ viral recombinase family protein [Anaerococcus sp.]|nr:YqaJ viral recombinase family protein [Peptoniphilaceae bacterium]MDY3055597.1 YqaJ viral recombinase family protein [Anaerococcus sp.]
MTYTNLVNVKDISHLEWLEYRQVGIGGSDAAAACGLSPWKSQAQLYFEKTTPIKMTEDNERMRQGRDFEDYVAKRFTEETGKKIRRNNFMMRDKEYPFLLADIDREVVGENAILECKTTSPFNKSQWENGQIPLQYELQCHHYMMVTGAERCYIACLIFSTDFFYRVIERDEEVIEMLREREIDFWRNYVEKEVIPAPDGSVAYDDALKARFKGENEQSIALNLKENDFKDYMDRKALIKDLEALNRKYEQEIKLQIGDNLAGENEFLSVTWKPAIRKSIDTKRIKKERPEIFEEYSKETEYRTLRIKEKEIIND